MVSHVRVFLQYGKKHPENMTIPLFRSMYLDEVLKNHDQIQLSENPAVQRTAFKHGLCPGQ